MLGSSSANGRVAPRNRLTACFALAGFLFAAGCTSGNNLVFGRVRAVLGGHRVVVTDCYRVHVPRPVRLAGSPATYAWAPCRDAVLELHGESLSVNGLAYGHLAPGTPITVGHGVVRVATD